MSLLRCCPTAQVRHDDITKALCEHEKKKNRLRQDAPFQFGFAGAGAALWGPLPRVQRSRRSLGFSAGAHPSSWYSRLTKKRSNGRLTKKQFEIVFSEQAVSERDAQALLEGNAPHPTYAAEFSQPTSGDAAETGVNEPGVGAKATVGVPQTYEVINMAPFRYLCSIPLIDPPGPENQTATALAKAEEARELSRAAANGWDLLNSLEDSCLYFMSGWWSYRFCNNHEIVQFHALSSTPAGQPPKRDPHTAEFVLGRTPAMPASSGKQSRKNSDSRPLPAELQIKGDQRYLVQRLVGGTICDLTGRERTIDVQYHCVPGLQADRIGWIKEVTICAYVMVVNTPRLCDDVAFLPAKEAKANPITCQLITANGKPLPPLLGQSQPSQNNADEQAQKDEELEPSKKQALTVGGIEIGARKVISAADEDGKPPAKLIPPRNHAKTQQTAEEKLIEVLVRAASKEDGGKVEALTAEQLESLDLKPEVIEEMREQLRELAGDDGWQLEIVELPDEELRELRGYINTKDGAVKKDKKGKKTTAKAAGGKEVKGKKKLGSPANTKKKPKADDGNGKQETEGSEETFFKDEL